MLAGIIESDAGAVAGISRSVQSILIAPFQVYIPPMLEAATHAYRCTCLPYRLTVADEGFSVTMHSVHADWAVAVCVAANCGADAHAVWCDSCAGHSTTRCGAGVAASEGGGGPEAQDGQAHRPRGGGHQLCASAHQPCVMPHPVGPTV